MSTEGNAKQPKHHRIISVLADLKKDIVALGDQVDTLRMTRIRPVDASDPPGKKIPPPLTDYGVESETLEGFLINTSDEIQRLRDRVMSIRESLTAAFG